MSEVFLSYRQTDEDQLRRVRAFGERLRSAGITVVLDQFLLDEHPGGPNDGWDKWSSDRALNAEYVLIIGTKEWFDCFEKKQKPGTGLGAACEADDLRHRIYEAGGVIGNIRVVLFDETDAAHIPGKLKRYHRFHAERDFANIGRWLKQTEVVTSYTPRTSIPHNLPSLQPFFGREEELKKIADALDPESRTWGALIDGPGGMGKTSLAVRAAYDAADAFEKIVFISLKSRELDDDGERDLSGFLISGLAELLNELARRLGPADIAKAPEEQRPRLLLDALGGTRTLLLLDNLESLLKLERDVVFNLVKRLPPGCKAILTSRRRIGSAAEELILEKLGEQAALDTIEELGERNPIVSKSTKEERFILYRETGGNPLLLRWTTGQIGRGSCLSLKDAITYLRSCPTGNDPLEFIFGDLITDFSEPETRVLCALTYFTLAAKVEHIFKLADCSELDADRALRSLVNRALVLPSEELKTFTLVPLVADFLRKKKPEVMADTGDRLEKQAYALIVENGFKYECLAMLETSWPMIAAALPRFLAGANDRLQTVCNALDDFFDFSGRWDERLVFARDSEERALAVEDFFYAGWRAYKGSWVHGLRGQGAKVLECADRIDQHWRKAQVGTRELAIAKSERGKGYQLVRNYEGAIAAYWEALELDFTLNRESRDVAIDLNSLATAEQESGDLDGAERDYHEALRIAHIVGYGEGVAIYTANLSLLALHRKNWVAAETLAREALWIAEKIGRQEAIAAICHRMAIALLQKGKKTEAFSYAKRAVKIYSYLSSPSLESAATILTKCET